MSRIEHEKFQFICFGQKIVVGIEFGAPNREYVGRPAVRIDSSVVIHKKRGVVNRRKGGEKRSGTAPCSRFGIIGKNHILPASRACQGNQQRISHWPGGGRV